MDPSQDTSAMDAPVCAGLWTLSRAIAALRQVATDRGSVSGGGVFELPEGAEIALCGEGFNRRTVTVRWQGELFFAFRQDLEPYESGAYIE